MRREYILIGVFLIAVISTFPLLGCLPSQPASKVEYESKSAHDSDISNVKNSISNLDEKKASVGFVNEQIQSVRNTVVSPSNAYSKSETYTRGEVDQKIKDAVDSAVKALKDDQTWLKYTQASGGGTVPVSDTGKVTFATNPAAIPQLFTASTGSGQSIFYTMKIINGSSTWQYVKPIINITVATSYSSTKVTALTIAMSGGSGCSMTGTGTSGMSTLKDGANDRFSVSPALNSDCTSMVVIPIGGCNGTGEFQIGAGQAMDILIQVTNMITTDTRLWNITNSISARSL